ncbi:unnamed protein product [Effrenium voratum]|uniref:Uncharacterized protein n=1 Tax=Effrenium voratum TaxID=2562239 RepID=A0AA36JTE1_9DINO|nr:unnamed protein product [Effrenium voratum]
MAAPSGAPHTFAPAPAEARARSSVPRKAKAEPEVKDVKAPAGGRYWRPQGQVEESARQEVRALLQRKPLENDFSGWQMPFPFELPSGERCPICALGECGDVNCAAYRPKHPEVRAAIEEVVARFAQQYLADGIQTYVSVGSGLLAQDWFILEKLSALHLAPSRAIFVDLRTAHPAIACEGRQFSGEDALDMTQLGFNSSLGPEFSFSAVVTFGSRCEGTRLFDFCNGIEEDNIYVELGPEEQGAMIFGVRRNGEDAQVTAGGAWLVGQPHLYLFTVSATGMLRIYIDNQLVVSQQGHPPERMHRKRLYVGRSSNCSSFFTGQMRKIQVWNYCVDSCSVDGLYADEAERALNQFASWFPEVDVFTFGSLASFAAAAEEDDEFQADLLLQIDVHKELDGFQDLAKKVLSSNGLALTLPKTGKSWRREKVKVVELRVESEVLAQLEEKKQQPWVFFGPGKVGRSHFCQEDRAAFFDFLAGQAG